MYNKKQIINWLKPLGLSAACILLGLTLTKTANSNSFLKLPTPLHVGHVNQVAKHTEGLLGSPQINNYLTTETEGKSKTESTKNNSSVNTINNELVKEKKVSETFNTTHETTLEVSNQYGNISVNTWNKPEVKITVTVTVSGKDEKAVNEKFETTKVIITEKGNKIKAETKIGKTGWRFCFFCTIAPIKVKVNYQINKPEHLNLILHNEYGEVFIDKNSGETKVNIEYGSFKAGALSNTKNQLNFDFSKGIDIDFLNEGKVKTAYSTFNIEQSNALEIIGDFSNITLGDVSALNFKLDYGNLTIRKVSKMDGNSSFIPIKIAQVSTSCKLSSSYGSFEISEIPNSCRLVDVKSSFTKLRFWLNESYSGRVKVKSSFTSISGEKYLGLEPLAKGIEKYIDIPMGENKNSENKISLNTDYGSISFNLKP
jgi:hypothetical protein